MKELINVSALERRILTLENRLLIAIKLTELQSIRLDAQLARIVELETLNMLRKAQAK